MEQRVANPLDEVMTGDEYRKRSVMANSCRDVNARVLACAISVKEAMSANTSSGSICMVVAGGKAKSEPPGHVYCSDETRRQYVLLLVLVKGQSINQCSPKQLSIHK